MSELNRTNLFTNPTLRGAPGDHGLPEGFTLFPAGSGVHYWKLPVRVEARCEVVASGGPDNGAFLRIVHPGADGFPLLDPWDDFLPKPGFVEFVGIRPDVARIEPANVDRLFCLAYWGRSVGRGYCHARIQGPGWQNDPVSIEHQREWRRIEHVFILDAGATLDSCYFYVRLPEEGDLVDLAGFDLHTEGEFHPRNLKPRPKIERLPQPDAEARVRINPPTLSWPEKRADARYDLELSPTKDFSRGVLRYASLTFNSHKPTTLLKPGVWFWRWREVGGTYGPPVSFTMPADAVEYLTPSFRDILAATRKDHPRLHATRETLGQLRRCVTVDNAAQWERWQREAFGDEDRRWGGRPSPGREIGIAAGKLWNHAFAWLITEKPEHAAAARRHLGELLRVPFTGVTQHRHSEINCGLSNTMGLAYDWLYDLLSEDEKARTREAIAARVEDMFAFYKANLGPFYSMERNLYDSHGTYMMQSMLVGALAIVGEHPGAEKWMEYWLMAGIGLYPPWSQTDGSWAQGFHYGDCYVQGLDIPEAHLVRSATGLNFFDKPFFRRHMDFLLYGFPPFSRKAPFGDIMQMDEPNDRDLYRCGRIARTLAFENKDPYAAWYSSVVDIDYGLQDRHALMQPTPEIAPKAPTDLPLAKVFPDTGWALMHTDLTGRDDVFLAFKSSPYGSISHSHADQNSFALTVGERRLFIDAGYYAGYGTPHHLGFYKQTKAHNCVLVNGRGQLINEAKAGGHITRFGTSAEIDYAVGDAQAAYGRMLERFDRHVVFLRPFGFVVFDDLVGEEPWTWEWLLHAGNPMHVDGRAGTIRTQNGPFFAEVHLRASAPVEFSLTDEFDPPLPMRDGQIMHELFVREFHFAASVKGKRKDVRFIAFIGVGELARAADVPTPEFVEAASWIGVTTPAGAAFFRTGKENGFTAGKRRIETDGRAVVLRSSGAFMASDATFLSIDGRKALAPEARDSGTVLFGRLD